MARHNNLKTFTSQIGFTASIVTDEDPLDPREHNDNLGRMACSHGRYKLGDTPKTLGWTFRSGDFDGWEAVEQHLVDECDAFVILPLYLYDHSGITIATKPFACRWDSGQIGFIYVSKGDLQREYPGLSDAELREKAEHRLNYEVEEYDQYLRGEVVGYVVEDRDGNVLDSCYGFYSTNDCETEAKSSLDWHVADHLKRQGARMDAVAMARAAVNRNAAAIPPEALETLDRALTAYVKV